MDVVGLSEMYPTSPSEKVEIITTSAVREEKNYPGVSEIYPALVYTIIVGQK